MDLRYSPEGAVVAKTAVAVSRREHAAGSLSKGDRVLVTGRSPRRNYEDREGHPAPSVEVVAADIAPALRFATADVVKNARGDDSRPRCR